MPTAALRYCLAPGCNQKVQGGRCPQHTTTYRVESRQHQDYSLYRQARWKRFRLAVLRDRPYCEDCEAQGRTRLAVDLHHKVKPSEDMTCFYDDTNVSPLCKPCHTARTALGE